LCHRNLQQGERTRDGDNARDYDRKPGTVDENG
jgi:hypothetical protein